MVTVTEKDEMTGDGEQRQATGSKVERSGHLCKKGNGEGSGLAPSLTGIRPQPTWVSGDGEAVATVERAVTGLTGTLVGARGTG
jgi:hypothetical protein